MSTSFLPDADATRAAVTALFADKPPVLVEVRFPNMGTSSDWFLCEDEDDLGPILDRLGPGAEVHLQSVWDLKAARGGVVVRK
jgi:hypothetical protein